MAPSLARAQLELDFEFAFASERASTRIEAIASGGKHCCGREEDNAAPAPPCRAAGASRRWPGRRRVAGAKNNNLTCLWANLLDLLNAV